MLLPVTALQLCGLLILVWIQQCVCRVLLLVMSSDLRLSATITKYFGQLFKITCSKDNTANDKNPLELVSTDETTRAKILLQQDVRDNRTQAPRLRQRVRAPAPAALPQEYQDEIQADQHQSTQGRAAVATVSFLL